jgi:hypothetical protein
VANGQGGKVASADHAGRDLQGGRIYATMTTTASSGDQTWLLRRGGNKVGLLCSVSRTSHPIPCDLATLRHHFTTSSACTILQSSQTRTTTHLTRYFLQRPLVLLSPAWSLRQRPKPLQRTDAYPVVTLHSGQRQLLASQLVEKRQRKHYHLPIVSCSPCALLFGHNLLSNSI